MSLCPNCGGLKRFMLSISPFTERTCHRCGGTGVVAGSEPNTHHQLSVTWLADQRILLRDEGNILAAVLVDPTERARIFHAMMGAAPVERVEIFSREWPNIAFCLGADFFMGWARGKRLGADE